MALKTNKSWEKEGMKHMSAEEMTPETWRRQGREAARMGSAVQGTAKQWKETSPWAFPTALTTQCLCLPPGWWPCVSHGHILPPAQGQHSLSTWLQSVGNQSALQHQSNRKVPAILTDHHGTCSDRHLSHACHSMVTTSAWLHLAFPSPPVAASWKFL